MVTQNSVFRERFEQYPVNKGLAHIMNKEDKKNILIGCSLDTVWSRNAVKESTHDPVMKNVKILFQGKGE